MGDSCDSYEIRGHTADIRLVLHGASLEALMTQAARGLYAVVGRLTAGARRIERRIVLEAPDRQTLLHDWMAELLYLLDARGQWFEEFDYAHCRETQLVVQATGAVIDLEASQIDREVKAVTFHDLEINEVNGILTAQVILDI